jgi:hypothetical protein
MGRVSIPPLKAVSGALRGAPSSFWVGLGYISI